MRLGSRAPESDWRIAEQSPRSPRRKHASQAQLARCENTFKTPGREPKTKKAKAMDELSMLKEVTGAATKEVRSPSSYPEESHGEHVCTKVVHSGESSPEEENTSEGSGQAANDKNQPEGDGPNAPADPDTQAEKLQSDKTDTEPMAWEERTASKSPPNDDYGGLFDDSESEEGDIDEPHEDSNDLDEQQTQYYSADSAAHAGQATALTTATVGPLFGGGAPRPKGYYPPEDGTGALQLLKKLTPPRGLVSGYT
ncbi:ABC Superfamily [Phytophthora cinnamomi]|uniref:ABC Superfamily n=1 Tax=Phytophthora cinnamomi TaxID=4785 RepID=UPI00355958CA|nr:ABC Superfamily [Phytophthora cinnamomi]